MSLGAGRATGPWGIQVQAVEQVASDELDVCQDFHCGGSGVRECAPNGVVEFVRALDPDPEFTVVVPRDLQAELPIAISVACRDERLVDRLNSWLETKKRDGAIGRFYDHWILGRFADHDTPRWSIVRDVLHWRE